MLGRTVVSEVLVFSSLVTSPSHLRLLLRMENDVGSLPFVSSLISPSLRSTSLHLSFVMLVQYLDFEVKR